MFQYDEKGVENMLLRIAVCDDEAIHRLIIRDKLDAYAISNDIDYELDEFTNSKELMKMENIYDILFLDVQLEDGMNGIEVGKRLLQKGIDATIIITTSFEQYASEGYHLKAHRYLIKPIEMPQKSYIVNFDHITSITKTKVILDYSTEIKLARDRMTNFNMKFQKYIRG